jgi:hypothetical protein
MFTPFKVQFWKSTRIAVSSVLLTLSMGSFITERPIEQEKLTRFVDSIFSWNYNDCARVLQGSLLSVTNVFEGTRFVDQKYIG